MERSRGEDFASKNNMIYVETSAIDTINVQEAFLSLVKSADSSVIAAAAAAAATTGIKSVRTSSIYKCLLRACVCCRSGAFAENDAEKVRLDVVVKTDRSSIELFSLSSALRSVAYNVTHVLQLPVGRQEKRASSRQLS